MQRQHVLLSGHLIARASLWSQKRDRLNPTAHLQEQSPGGSLARGRQLRRAAAPHRGPCAPQAPATAHLRVYMRLRKMCKLATRRIIDSTQRDCSASSAAAAVCPASTQCQGGQSSTCAHRQHIVRGTALVPAPPPRLARLQRHGGDHAICICAPGTRRHGFHVHGLCAQRLLAAKQRLILLALAAEQAQKRFVIVLGPTLTHETSSLSSSPSLRCRHTEGFVNVLHA